LTAAGRPDGELTLPPEPSAWQSIRASIAGVIAKEARWRMRGRRAFVVVTVYLCLLAVLVFFVYQSILNAAVFATQFTNGDRFPTDAPTDFVPGSVSATVGQGVFAVILVLQTLLTVLIAPAMTSGSVSTEREKQTLDLLITTPVSTLGMVAGKLFSSLAYLLLLIASSVPLMSIVFAFGGIAPDDVVRAYIMLFAASIGLGSIGLFMSALFKRSQVATALSYVVVFGLILGGLLVHTWMFAGNQFDENGDFIPLSERRLPSEALLWLNPFVADLDVMCTAVPDAYGITCSYPAAITGHEFDASNPPRDQYWPRSALALVLMGVVLTLASTQLIAPSRRFRRSNYQRWARLGNSPPDAPDTPAGNAAQNDERTQ
jgi:ABC-type transport system involved in multi-copper enzyme maturation permease subunit